MSDGPAEAPDAVGAAPRKAVQRERCRQLRAEMDAGELRSAAARIGALVDGLLPEAASSGVLVGYAALPVEVSVEGVLERARAAGRRTALPRVEGPGRLLLHEVTGADDELEAGAFGILEPRSELTVVDPSEVAVVLVPGLAFDAAGRRLGMGGGFYDRLLPQLPGALRLGICPRALLLDEVVTDAHDEGVDAVVTEVGVYR